MANEKRLIDGNVCLHDMCKRCNIENEACPCEPPDCFIYNVIQNAPTVDAVEVVRCKDCRNCMLWRKPTEKVIGECFIRKMNSEDEQFCMVGADDFCSYGERRTDELP